MLFVFPLQFRRWNSNEKISVQLKRGNKTVGAQWLRFFSSFPSKMFSGKQIKIEKTEKQVETKSFWLQPNLQVSCKCGTNLSFSLICHLISNFLQFCFPLIFWHLLRNYLTWYISFTKSTKTPKKLNTVKNETN